MIKKCPICNRTYADETISFCLADGALLSAPYDPDVQIQPDQDNANTDAPTEILPPQFSPTQPAVEAKVIPTITAALPTPWRQTMAGEALPAGKRPLVIAALVIIFLVVALLVVYLAFTRRTQRTAEATVNASPDPSIVVQSSPIPISPGVQRPSPIPIATVSPARNRGASPTPKNSPEKPAPTPARLDADPVLVPPDNKTTDSSKVFSGREVDQPARILSRPSPAYTEEARKNQVYGVIVLRVVFSSSGEVTNITVVRGLPDGLSERAIAAARQIKFEPARKDGRAVSMYMQLQYNFSLY